MRLFKFLVISDEVVEKYGLPFERKNADGTPLNTKNEFFNYCYDINLNHPEKGDKAIVFMSIDYPNEGKDFGYTNKAYAIINANDIEEVMKLISPSDNNSKNKFKGCTVNNCNRCMKLSKPCRNKNVSINVDKNYIRGKTWSFANDKSGTKNNVTEDLAGNLITRRIEPKTGGIAYSSIQWKDGIRPEAFKEKTIAVPLHHWIKCNSIPPKPAKKGNYSFYHIGHTFDYRKEFIGLATKREQENLRKEIEPKNNIRRGRRVLAGQGYFSRTLECDCRPSESNPKCRDCEGVLYIDTEQGLEDLYYQLLSNEYRQLSEGKTI